MHCCMTLVDWRCGGDLWWPWHCTHLCETFFPNSLIFLVCVVLCRTLTLQMDSLEGFNSLVSDRVLFNRT